MYQCFFTARAKPACGAALAIEPPRPFAARAEPPPIVGNAAARPEVVATGLPVRPGNAASSFPAAIPAVAGDFDFLHGQWLVENRRVAEPFGAAPGTVPASSDGIVFDSVHACRPLATGGHLEEMAIEERVTVTVLRLFDAHSRRWRIYRLSPGDATLEGPLLGGFEGGVGTFVGEESWRGRPVLVRETWARVAEKPRWEQAFSSDGGHTWSTRWIRDFIRVDWPQ